MLRGFEPTFLVCLSAAIVVVLTIEIAYHSAFQAEGVRLDPICLIEAVTAGVAFLAAGMIVFNKGQIKGLNTGAALWLPDESASPAGRFWQIGLIATLFVVRVLWLMHRLDNHLPLPPATLTDPGPTVRDQRSRL
jgi:putative Mg2+ transporter-C (MgtC) family protein